MGLFTQGYKAFITIERDFNDGEQACDAEIQATNNKTNATVTYYGKSTAGHGHGEIDALYQFLRAIYWNTTNYDQYTVTVTCEAKPCCKYCAAVMGNLGIFATPGTYKAKKAMGVSYALPPDVRTFLKNYLNTTEQKILDELCA
jgi:hypothetical protein